METDTAQSISIYIGIIADIVGALSLIFGAFIGWKAIKKYHQQNEIDAEQSLVAADNEIYYVIRNNPFLESFFMVCENGISPKEKADRLLSALLYGTPGKYCSWSNVKDIVDWPWEEQDFYSEEKERFRLGIYLAERIIVLLTLSYEAWQDGLITEEDYHGYANYIDTIGFHPLFLAAIYYWKRHNFICNGFTVELRQRLLSTPENKEMIRAIYSQLESNAWTDVR